jgi:hypothetical protein
MQMTEKDIIETCEVHGFPLDPDQLEVVTAVVNQILLSASKPAVQRECTPVARVLPDMGNREYSGVTLTRSKPVAERHNGKPLYDADDLAAAMPAQSEVSPIVAPYPECSFRICDLPGQCRGEGKCHHPAAPAQSGEPIYQIEDKGAWVDVSEVAFTASDLVAKSRKRIVYFAPQPAQTAVVLDDEPTTIYDPAHVRAKFADYQSQIDGMKEELAYARAASPQPVEQTGDPVAWRIEQRAGRYTFVEHVENLKLYAGANIVPLFRAFRSVDSNLNTALDRLESMVTWEPRLLDGADAIDRLENINGLLYELLNPHPTAVAQPVEQTERALTDARDAARYWWVREYCDIDYRGNLPEGFNDSGDAIDAAIAAARPASGGDKC